MNEVVECRWVWKRSDCARNQIACRLMVWVAYLRERTAPKENRDLRVYLSLYMMVYGAARLITGASAMPINIIPARVWGGCSAVLGLLFLATSTRLRYQWPGRSVAIAAVVLWLLLLWDNLGAWVSVSTGSLITLAIANEVRARGH